MLKDLFLSYVLGDTNHKKVQHHGQIAEITEDLCGSSRSAPFPDQNGLREARPTGTLKDESCCLHFLKMLQNLGT